MAPKKDKGKKEEPGAGAFTEVERTFLELQIAESNRKIARLRSAVDEYETRNQELQQAYDKLDEDRADIIAYLKKVLTTKNDENNELKEKVKGLEETRAIESAQFNETVAELEKNFTLMKDQLTSENKLLAGKLNTLEEFRAVRDDLMKKFEKQEEDFKNQEMKYKRIIYETEKKFIKGKDLLKKEMEARLLQLAQDFQDATESRIAASTHRVIRENIAINHELDNILAVQLKLSEQNEIFKTNALSARTAMELAEEERDEAINKNVTQLRIIEQLTTAFQDIKKEKALADWKNYDNEVQLSKIQFLSTENEKLVLQLRILEQNLHAKMIEQNKSTVESTKISKERDKLRKIIREAAFAVQAALKLDHWASTDPMRETMDRQVLLTQLLEIMSQYREIEQPESISTVDSFTRIYQEGDLGFVPRPSSKKSILASRISKFTGISKDSFKPEKDSTTSLDVSSPSLGSISTVPSIKLIPPGSDTGVTVKDSQPSLLELSLSSETTSKIDSESSGADTMEKKLEASKLEIQKSILKDLAFSHMSVHAFGTSMPDLDKEKKKSVVIVDTSGSHKPALDIDVPPAVDVNETDTILEQSVEMQQPDEGDSINKDTKESED